MSLTSLVAKVQNVVYGSGLGEKPALRIGNADSAESISGSLITFALASGEADKVKPGNILSVYGGTYSATSENAHVLYVTSVSSTTTETVTAVNGYLGSPAASTDDLDGVILAQNATWTDHEIIQAINTVIDQLLYPWVYQMADATIANPDLRFGQETVGDEVEEIIAAWQVIGSEKVAVPVSRQPIDIDFGTSRMAEFDWVNGSTGYYTYISKYTIDTLPSDLESLVALGAAAVLLGAALSETTLEATKKDNAEAVSQRGSAADRIWRDFLTLRSNVQETLARRRPQRIFIDRG